MSLINSRQLFSGLFIFFFFICSSWVLYLVLPIGGADFFTIEARQSILKWQKQDQMPDSVDWGYVRNRLISAHAISPTDPQILEYLAYLHILQAVRTQRIPELSEAMYDQGVEYYQNALLYRPMSPYAWANVALVLSRRGNYGNGFWFSYDRAIKYGHREGGVQRIVADIAFSRWDTLSVERRKQVLLMLSAATPGHRQHMLKLAHKRGVNTGTD